MTTKQDDIIINVQKREVTGKQVKQLRRQGILPAVVYGHKVDSYPVQMDTHSTYLLLRKITPTTLITLNMDGKKTKVMIRERKFDVVTGDLLHLDFLAVSMTEKMRASVAIELVGDAPVLDEVPGSLLNHMLESLEIEGLPADLPERIQVDVSSLVSAEDSITVADLKLGDKIEIHTPAEEVIVSVSFVAAAEAEEGGELEEGGAEPEVMEKGKKEEDEE